MSTPDPEETEREALDRQIDEARRCAVIVYLATDAPVADDISRILNGLCDALAARRLSESEIRREWGVLTQGNDDHETFWCSTEDNARAIMHDGDTLMSRSAAVPAGEWTREEK